MSELSMMGGFPFEVSFSPDGETQAEALAGRMRQAAGWIDQLVGLPWAPSLFVVGPADWPRVSMGVPYGIPHVGDDRIVAGLDGGPLWEALLSRCAPHMPAGAWDRLTDVYGDPPDLRPFVDLLVVHELGHVTHGESWAGEPAGLWLDELASNVILHGYVDQVEPWWMPSLETLFDVVRDTPRRLWPVRDLDRMADTLDGDWTNYLWFEFGLQQLARRLWHSAGSKAVQGLVELLRGPVRCQEEVLDTIATYDADVAQALRRWARA